MFVRERCVYAYKTAQARVPVVLRVAGTLVDDKNVCGNVEEECPGASSAPAGKSAETEPASDCAVKETGGL
jgi:hypothetical protein